MTLYKTLSQENTSAGRVEKPPLCQGHHLVSPGARAEKVPHFVLYPAKAFGRLDTLAFPHRTGALFDAAMVRLQVIIQVAVDVLMYLFPGSVRTRPKNSRNRYG